MYKCKSVIWNTLVNASLLFECSYKDRTKNAAEAARRQKTNTGQINDVLNMLALALLINTGAKLIGGNILCDKQMWHSVSLCSFCQMTYFSVT